MNVKQPSIMLALVAFSAFFTGNHETVDNPAGTIAYIRGWTEIRLIEPDGSNDRQLWTHKDAKKELGLFNLAWRPDGKELAFSSGHAATSSLYHSDLYAINPDGLGLRKMTNPPDRNEFSRYPKGTVRLLFATTSLLFNNHRPAQVFLWYM